MEKKVSELVKNIITVRENLTLVHNITNYVTVNDCANILLSCGASPIMADDINEVEDITSICHALNINIGTLNDRVISSMIKAGKQANRLGKKVLLDPVGVGASSLRNDTTKKLIEEVKFDVVRGNISEIKMLASMYLNNTTTSDSHGVDANGIDVVTLDNLKESIQLVKELALELDTIVSVSGAIDLVSDGEQTYVIKNGHDKMTSVTGTGCMLSAMMAAFIGANSDTLKAAVSASLLMAVAGQRAASENSAVGNMTYRNLIIDMIGLIDEHDLNVLANVECYE